MSGTSRFSGEVGEAHLVRSSVGVTQLDVLFVFDSVQVFVQSVQQEGQQLLTVMLLVTQELRCKVTHLRLQTHTNHDMQQHSDEVTHHVFFPSVNLTVLYPLTVKLQSLTMDRDETVSTQSEYFTLRTAC